MYRRIYTLIVALLLWCSASAWATVSKCGTPQSQWGTSIVSTLSVNSPSGCTGTAAVDTELLLVVTYYNVPATVSTPSGFSVSSGSPFTAGLADVYVFCQRINSGGTIPSSTTVTVTSGGGSMQAYSYAATGMASGTGCSPLDVAPAITTNTTSSTAIPTNGATTLSDGDIIVEYLGNPGNTDEGAGTSYTASPNGTTEADITRSTTGGVGFSILTDWSQSSHGATGTDTFTTASSTGDSSRARTGLTIAIAPASTAAQQGIVIIP